MIRALLSVTVMTAFILSLLVWLVQSLRYCSMMAYTSLSLIDVGWLAFYLWPKTIIVCTSLSYIYGIVWVYGRWKRDNIITAIQSSGASHGFLWWPAVMTGCLLSLGLYPLALSWGPRAAQLSHHYAQVVDKRFNPSFLIPKVFFSMAGKTLYSGEQVSTQEWKNVMIHDISSPETERLFYAKRVFLIPQDDGLWVDVTQGMVATIRKDKDHMPHCIYWKRYQGIYRGDLETAKSLANLPPHRWAETLDLKFLRSWKRPPTTKVSLVKTEPTNVSKKKNLTKSTSYNDGSPEHPSAWPVEVVSKALRKETQYRWFWSLWPVMNAVWLPSWWICDHEWKQRIWRAVMLFAMYAGIMTGGALWSILIGIILFVMTDGRKLWRLQNI